MYQTDYEEVQRALYYLDPNDRDTWWKMGAALKSEFDEGGKALWEDWSRSYPKWNERESNAQWKSFKHGHINIGTLFHLAQQNGFEHSQNYQAPSAEQIAQREAVWAIRREVQVARDTVSQNYAATQSQKKFRYGKPTDGTHAYLQSKGVADVARKLGITINRYTDKQGVAHNDILVPIYADGKLINLQSIAENGSKKFEPYARVSGGSTLLGDPKQLAHGAYLVEGLATGLSIVAATDKPVIIAFNAGNLPHIAHVLNEKYPDAPIAIAADNDISQTGIKKAAEAAQILGERASIMLPEFNADDIANFQAKHGQGSFPSDFNDLHELHGLAAVQDALNQPLSRDRLPEIAVSNEARETPNEATYFQRASIQLDPAEAQQLYETELAKINNGKIREAVKQELAARGVAFRQPEREKLAEHDMMMAHSEPTKQEMPMQPETLEPDELPTIRAERAPWNDFPSVIRNGNLGELKNEPEYQAAKSGDVAQADALVQRLLNDETIEQIRQMIGNRQPVLVPVSAVESAGNNKIPLAMAYALSERLNLPVETDIQQINKVSRTGSGIDHRLAHQPIFDGRVQAGRDYLIMDDTLSVGSTVASLRGFVENRGGHVVGAAVMTAHEGALNIAVKPAMIEKIRQKHGDTMDNYWKQEFGYGIEQLTQGEAGHLRAAPNVEQIRDRIAAARHTSRPSMVATEPSSPSASSIRQTARRDTDNTVNPDDPTADVKPTSAVLHEKQETKMAQQLTPEQIQQHAQDIANIGDSNQRDIVIDEFTERYNINIKSHVNEILDVRQALLMQHYAQDNPYAPYAAYDDEARKNADAWQQREPLTAEKMAVINQKLEQSGFSPTDVEPYQAGVGAFVTQKEQDNRLTTIYGEFKNHGGASVYESAYDYTVENRENDEVEQYFHTNDLDEAIEVANKWLNKQQEVTQQEEMSQTEPTQAIGQPENTLFMEQQLKAELESADLPNNMYFETETLSNGRAIARIKIPDYDNEIMLDKLEQGGYIATFNDFHLEFNQLPSSAFREMTAQLEREYRESQTMQQTAEILSATAAEPAAVAASEPTEAVAAATQATETIEPTSEQNEWQDEQAMENTISFDGEAQELSPQNPSERQPETITPAEVERNLANAKIADQYREQELARQPENTHSESNRQHSPDDELGSLFDASNPTQPQPETPIATLPSQPPKSAEPLETPSKPKPVLDLDYPTAAGLEARYVRVGGKYMDLHDRKTVAFKDKGDVLKTSKTDAQIISDMLDTAQAKNWGVIKISGSREFKQQMWLEASLRGIPSKGYKPNAYDIVKRDQLLEERQRNSIEAVQSMDKTPERQPENKKQPETTQQPSYATSASETKQQPSFADNATQQLAEADKLQTQADMPDERRQAAQFRNEAVHNTQEMQRASAPQKAADINPSLDSARAVFEEKYAKLSDDAKARLAWNWKTNHEPYFKHLKSSGQEKWHNDMLKAYYENTAKLMHGKSVKLEAVFTDASPQQVKQFEQVMLQQKQQQAQRQQTQQSVAEQTQKKGRKM